MTLVISHRELTPRHTLIGCGPPELDVNALGASRTLQVIVAVRIWAKRRLIRISLGELYEALKMGSYPVKMILRGFGHHSVALG
jgi:hypothetical protein